MPFTTYTTGKKITSIKGSYGCPRWFDAVYSGDIEYIRKHAKNIGKVSVAFNLGLRKIEMGRGRRSFLVNLSYGPEYPIRNQITLCLAFIIRYIGKGISLFQGKIAIRKNA